MMTFLFFAFMVFVLLFGLGFVALTLRHHYIEYQKEKATKATKVPVLASPESKN